MCTINKDLQFRRCPWEITLLQQTSPNLPQLGKQRKGHLLLSTGNQVTATPDQRSLQPANAMTNAVVHLGLSYKADVQGDSFHRYSPKKLKYGKPRLGESTLT